MTSQLVRAVASDDRSAVQGRPSRYFDHDDQPATLAGIATGTDSANRLDRFHKDLGGGGGAERDVVAAIGTNGDAVAGMIALGDTGIGTGG